MSNYGSIDTKIQNFMYNTSRAIICYFSAVANEDSVYCFHLHSYGDIYIYTLA